MDFVNFYLASFTPTRRSVLVSLYKDESVLTYADQGNEQVARGMLPTVIEQDWDIKGEQDAELKMRESVGELTKIRKKYNLPQVCG